MGAENLQNKIPCSPQGGAKPNTSKGFRFLSTFGDKMGTNLNYKSAKLHDKGDKWFVYYSYRHPHTDKFVRFKVYEDINRIKDLNKRRYAAMELLGAVNDMLKSGHNPFEVEEKKVWTLGQAISLFTQKIPSLGLRIKSEQVYNSFIGIIRPAFGHHLSRPIKDIDKKLCQSVLGELKSERSWTNTRYNNALRFGRRMWSFFIESEICETNPFKTVKPLQETKTKNQPFTNKHWELIQNEADPELRRFILFLYHTGVRPNEARQLTYEHILRDRKLLLIPAKISKNKADGYVPVEKVFLEEFKGKGVIFGTSVNYFSRKFLQLRTRLKLPKEYTLYSTKHTRAVHMAEDGVQPYAMMAFFRHSGLDVTMEYLRGLGVNVSREAADKVR